MKNYSLLTSPVGRTLFFKSLPVFLGIFAHIAYNLVDTFFVAKLGTNQLAAMSFSFPIVMIVLNLMMGIATGVTSVVAVAIGAKNHDDAHRLRKKGIELTMAVSFLISILGILTINPLFRALGVDHQLMGYTKDYMVTWYLGVVFMNLTIVAGAIFRARGEVFFPSLMLIIGAVLNAALDPILIFGWGFIPAMGVKGAALTTVFGNVVSTIFMYRKLYKEDNLTIPLAPKTLDFKIVKRILVIAIPTALANSLTPFSTAVTNKMLVFYGNAAVAANSIATRLETVPFIAIFALAAIMTAFVGQNWGAKNFDRIRLGIKKSFLFSYLLGIGFATLFIWQRNTIGSYFDTNPQVVEITSKYFSLIPLTYGILGTVFLAMQTLNAINKPFTGNFLSALRLIVLYLPLAYFLNSFIGVEGIFLSRFIANSIVGLLTTWIIFRTFFKAKASETEASLSQS